MVVDPPVVFENLIDLPFQLAYILIMGHGSR